ncbi:hypothetical protein ILYODFUR_006838 [Ilyodon furcidens]|uniref:Uncharacterized protein n=1 Tax=Ilyodon furcidens TaxID=33524 RepID=A0ABV0VBS3_9TELE
MSGPASLLDAALDPVASHDKHWKDLKIDSTSSCNLSENGYSEYRWSADMSTRSTQGVEVTHADGGDTVKCDHLFLEHNVKQKGAAAPDQQEERPTMMTHPAEMPSAFSPLLDMSYDNHLSECVKSSEDTSLDVLRIVKHKPSAIVFCDYEGSSDPNVTVVNESSDGRESSSSSTSKGEEREDDDADVDEFPKTLQYKEFLVSRHRRSLNRNRKCLRKRPEVPSQGPAADWQKTSNNKRTPESAGSKEEEDARQTLTVTSLLNRPNYLLTWVKYKYLNHDILMQK